MRFPVLSFVTAPRRIQELKVLYDRTKLIDDAKSPNPRFRGLIHGTSCIVREEGLRGIYRGLFPVVRLSMSRL